MCIFSPVQTKYMEGAKCNIDYITASVIYIY